MDEKFIVKLNSRLEALMNRQGELFFEQIYSTDKNNIESINQEIEVIGQEIFDLSNKIFDLE